MQSLSTPQIIYEDDDHILLNKPAGWLSIPGRNGEGQALTQWLTQHLNGGTPFVVHRLDRFTSGVMVYAKTAQGHKDACSWFLHHEVQKVYHFLAAPPPSRPAIKIKAPIEGKPAQTLFEVIQSGTQAFYGKATPLTGRFHQIREHARTAGFPLLGDRGYGGAMKLPDQTGKIIEFPRFCLHAYRLKLPFGEFEAPLPDDLSAILKLVVF